MKVLFVPCYIGGHTNAMIGLATELRKRGHQPIFFVDETKKSLLNGFNIENRDNSANPISEYTIPVCGNGSTLLSYFKRLFSFLIFWIKFSFYTLILMFSIEKQLQNLIKKIEPDLIILDDTHYPSIVHSGRPWLVYWSSNPILLRHATDRLPLGFEYRNRYLISIYRKMCTVGFIIAHSLFHLMAGYKCRCIYSPKLPCLRLYNYPKEIDYEYESSNAVNTLNLESTIHPDMDNKIHANDLVKFIKESENKLILISFGSYVSFDVIFMKKIVEIVSKTKYKYIISKGEKHASFQLADNMWGAQSIPQRQILPFVDIVINHGGNNTFTEAFYYGKPQIIIPFQLDQFDNALRVKDFNLGIYIKNTEVTEGKLINAIDYLIQSEEIKTKLSKISARMQSESRFEQATDMLENLVKEFPRFK